MNDKQKALILISATYLVVFFIWPTLDLFVFHFSEGLGLLIYFIFIYPLTILITSTAFVSKHGIDWTQILILIAALLISDILVWQKTTFFNYVFSLISLIASTAVGMIIYNYKKRKQNLYHNL